MNCTICCENIKSNEKFVILSCKCPYSYHENCLSKWLKMSKSCPTCRNKWIAKKEINHAIKFYGSCDYSKYLKLLIK